MTGRARGRSRGRGRSGQPPADVRRPGGDDAGATRGRSRGAAPPAQPAAPPQQAQAPPQKAAAPPTQAMEQLSVGEGGRQERRPRYTQYQEIECRPQWCTDKRGTSGKQVGLVSNYFRLDMKPGKKYPQSSLFRQGFNTAKFKSERSLCQISHSIWRRTRG